MFGKKFLLIPAYKIFDKEDKFQEPYILTILNHFRNNTHLPYLDNIKPLIHNPNLQPSLHPVKVQKEHSSNSIIAETTATVRHCNDSDDTNISGITCFSSTIIDTSLSYAISMHEANETSTSEEISMFSQLPSKYKHITSKDNPINNIVFKEQPRTETKEMKKLNINEEIIEFPKISNNPLSNTSKLLFKVFGNEPIVEQFDKHHKSLKAVKSNENRESYKDCIAQLEIKLICTEDNLKKELQKMELQNLKNNKSLNLLSNNTAENSKMSNIILKLKAIKKLRTELKI